MSDTPDYYAIFLNAISGLIDDAEMLGWDEDGIAQLREANEFFRSDYRIRRQAEQDAADREADLRAADSEN